ALLSSLLSTTTTDSGTAFGLRKPAMLPSATRSRSCRLKVQMMMVRLGETVVFTCRLSCLRAIPGTPNRILWGCPRDSDARAGAVHATAGTAIQDRLPTSSAARGAPD